MTSAVRNSSIDESASGFIKLSHVGLWPAGTSVTYPLSSVGGSICLFSHIICTSSRKWISTFTVTRPHWKIKAGLELKRAGVLPHDQRNENQNERLKLHRGCVHCCVREGFVRSADNLKWYSKSWLRGKIRLAGEIVIVIVLR